MDITSGVQQVVYQVVPPEHQATAMWLLGIALSLWALRNFIKPFMDKWATNKQTAAIAENAFTPEQVQLLVKDGINDALIIKAKAEAQKDLGTWQYKLIHASTQEAKDMCNLEIAKAQAIING